MEGLARVVLVAKGGAKVAKADRGTIAARLF